MRALILRRMALSRPARAAGDYRHARQRARGAAAGVPVEKAHSAYGPGRRPAIGDAEPAMRVHAPLPEELPLVVCPTNRAQATDEQAFSAR